MDEERFRLEFGEMTLDHYPTGHGTSLLSIATDNDRVTLDESQVQVLQQFLDTVSKLRGQK